MSIYTSFFYKIWSYGASIIANTSWTSFKAFITGRKGFDLSDEDRLRIREILATHYCVILTYRKTHLSTFSISFLTWIKTGKWPQYVHVLMNVDPEDNPELSQNFRLVEATSKGVHFSHFDDVFDCDRVCLMAPANMRHEDWDLVMENVFDQIGKPYDNLFNIADQSHLSCVEMVFNALRGDNNELAQYFPNLVKEVDSVGNLTPQMYRECPDFTVLFETKK